MALQGTIETFALPEVLRLLGSGGKTGRLRLSGDRGSGSIWVDGGKVVAAEATGIREGSSSTGVVFELLRYTEGSFSFDDDQATTRPGNPQDIEVLLGEAERQLADWREIEAVVPSLAVRMTLTDELPEPDVTLDGNCWKAVVAVARGGDVASIADALDLEELEACRRAKDLIETGLAVVTELVPAVVEDVELVETAGASDAGTVVDEVARLGADPVSAPEDGGAFAIAAEPTPPEGWSSSPVEGQPGHEAADTFGGAIGAFDGGEPPAPGPDPLDAGGYGEPAGPVGVNGYDGGSHEAASYGSGVFGAEPSSARADLDAMASGFGLTDTLPAVGGEPCDVPAHDVEDGGSFEGGSFEGGSFEGGGFDSGGFDQAFATDPSQDPAFSFAAPAPASSGYGAGEPPAPMAPGAALFADDLHSGAAAGSSDPRFAGAATGVDDGGDAAEVARQLANLSPKAARAVAAAARATTVEEREAALAEVTAEGDEPINRGLLLKFLSSVQT